MDQNLLFAAASGQHLVPSLCRQTGLRLAKYRLGRFADGEISLHLDEPVALKVAFVLASFFPPADNLLELLTLVNTLHINGVARVVAVIPYLGYGKSDRLDRPDIPVNARLYIECLEVAGVDQFVTVNVHSRLINRFFSVPHQELSAMPLFAEVLKAEDLTSLTVVAPDQGGIDRAAEYARSIGQTDIVVIEKHRPADDQTKVVKVTGDVKDRDLVLVDDMIQTGRTLMTAAKALKDLGARAIYVAATHFVYSAGALDPLTADANIKALYTTNTIPTPEEVTLPEKFKVLSIEPLLATALKPLLTA